MDELDSRAVEKSTYAITLTFTDSTEQSVSPDTLSWSLTDLDGNIINSREDVTVSSPSSTETIVLSGDDLAIPNRSKRERILSAEGTYTSDLGSGLPIKESVKFIIIDFFEPPEILEPVIIVLREVRSLLQIASSDSSKDENIKILIPIIQDWVREYCNNTFEVIGTSLQDKKTISFEHDDEDDPEIRDDGVNFLDEGFDNYLTSNSVTGTGIAFVDGGASEDSITDTGSGFVNKGFKKGMKFAVLDSDDNDGIYTVTSVVAGTITVITGSFTAETAGETITVTRGISVRVEGSLRNDGKYKVKKITGGKLYLFDNEIIVDEKKKRIITLTIITEIKYPQGIKLPIAKLIGYSLSQKDPGIESEKLGDYSVKFRTDYPESLMEELSPWNLNTIELFTTETTSIIDEEDTITIELELS